MVGDYSDADEFVHGFTGTEVDGFTTLDFQNNMTGLRAINQRGDISGIYFDGVALHGFLPPKNGTEAHFGISRRASLLGCRTADPIPAIGAYCAGAR